MAFVYTGSPENTGEDNVLDLKRDERLKLQLEIAQQLKDLKNDHDISNYKNLFNEKNSLSDETLQLQELRNLKAKILGDKPTVGSNNLNYTDPDLSTNIGAGYSYDNSAANNLESIDQILKNINNKLIGGKTVDQYVEELFDKWIIGKNYPNINDAELPFTQYLLKDPKLNTFFNEIFAPLKEIDIDYAKTNYKFELNSLEREITGNRDQSRDIVYHDPDYNTNTNKIENIDVSYNTPSTIIYENIKYVKDEAYEVIKDKDISWKKSLRSLFGSSFLGIGFARSIDNALDIKDQDYTPTGPEKEKLKDLKRAFKILGEENIQKAFKDVINSYNSNTKLDKGNDEKIAEALQIIWDAWDITQHTDKEGYDYLREVMILLENQIIKADNDNTTDIVTSHRDNKELKHENRIDNDRDAWKQLESEESQQKLEINFLKKLTDKESKIWKEELDSFLNTSRDKLRKNKYDSIDELVKLIEPNLTIPADGTNTAQQQLRDYFKDGKEIKNNGGVYDITTLPTRNFLNTIEAYSLGMSIQEYAQQSKISKLEKPDGIDNGTLIFARLGDFNMDGEVGIEDKGTVSGQQLFHAYKQAVEMVGQDKVFENLKTWVKKYCENNNLPYFKKKIENISNFNGLKDLIDKDPGMIKLLQDTLLKSPLEMTTLLTDGENAYQEDLNILGLSESDKITIKANIKEKLEEQKIELPNAIYEGLVQAVSSQIIQINGDKIVGGIGTKIPLDSLLEGLGISVGVDSQGVAGIGLIWNKALKIDKDSSFSVTPGVGLNSLFMPFVGVGVGYHHQLKINGKTLDAQSLKRIDMGPNIGYIPVLGFTVGVNIGRSRDKEQGINLQYENLKKKLSPVIQKCIDEALKVENNTPEARKKAIRYIIDKAYGGSEESTNHAADNIYTGLMYFGLWDRTGTTISNIERNIYADMMSEFYALNWKNDNINNIDNSYVSGVSLGVQLLAGYCPIPTACVQIAKHKYLYYTDTRNSLNRMKSSEYNQGIKISGENGIDNAAINNLNDLIKEKISGIGTNIDKISITDNLMKIPRSFFEKGLVDVKIDESLKGYIKFDDQKNLVVPQQISMAINTQYMQKGQNLVLNLGNTHTTKEVLNLSNFLDKETLPDGRAGTPEKYVALDGKDKFEKDLQAKIDVLKTTYGNDFPIDKVSLDVATQTITYTLKTGNFNGLTAPITQKLGQKLDISFDGTTKIYTKTLGTDTSSNTSNFSFEVKNYERILPPKALKNIELVDADIKEIKDICDRLTNEDLIKIKSWDEENKSKFFGFIANSDDSGQYQTALDSIKDLVASFTGDYQTTLSDLISSSNNINKKTYFADYIKMIFADNGIGSVSEKLNRHGGFGFLDIQGPEKTAKFLEPFKTNLKNYKNNFKNNSFTEYTTRDGFNENKILGYTGRYRRDTKNEEAKNYSLTALGSTKIAKQDGKNYITKFEESDVIEAKTWFLANIKKNRPQQEMILNMVQNACGVNNIQNQIDSTGSSKIEKLLNGESVDIGGKNVKLNVDYVFYLLEPCANESTGIQIKDIVITEKINKKNEISATYTNNIGLYSSSGQTVAGANYGKTSKFNIGFDFGVEKPDKGSQEPDTGGGDNGFDTYNPDTDGGDDGFIGGNGDGGLDGGKKK